MQAKPKYWPILLPFTVLVLSTVACGGFQIRVTPAASPSPQSVRAAPTATPPPPTTPTISVQPTRPPTAAPTATLTPVAGLAPGKSARVTASGGINMRDIASANGKLVTRVAPNAVVVIKDGPKDAEGYTWWQIDDGIGNVGWVAGGTKDDPWLSVERGSSGGSPAASGGGKLVDRAVRLGDRVQVTTQEGKLLSVRDGAGTGGTLVARALPGTQFTVRSGPVRQDGYLWWELEGEQVKGWAAEGEEGDRWLTPVEQ